MNGVSVTFQESLCVWEFPRWPHVEFEPSDEQWCRPLGIGREVTRRRNITIPNVHFHSTEFEPGGECRIRMEGVALPTPIHGLPAGTDCKSAEVEQPGGRG